MSILNRIKQHLLFIILLIISAVILMYFSYYNECSEGGSDNIWHYYFSKYAFQYPNLFLHHWGKPLFILLSSPFAQFGFFGITIFNILCGILSAIFSYKILNHLHVKFSWFIAPLLIFSPLYFTILQSSLTEPLFSLVLITATYFYFKNKFALATVIISFILFSRSEGFFIIGCFLLFLIISKQWKFIPLLLTGFLIYSTVGFFMGHDFFWFFTENPYALKSPYGHGHFLDMFGSAKSIWGLPFFFLWIFSSIVLFILFIKQKHYFFWKPLNETSYIFYLLFIPSFVFLLFHLIVWHFGMFGSAGLHRVMASVFPSFAVLSIWGINKVVFSKFTNVISLSFIGVFLVLHLQTPFLFTSYPLKATGGEKIEIEAAKWFKTISPDSCIIYYSHAGIIYNLNKNPFDKKHHIEMFGFNEASKIHKSLPTYVFWDSEFSEFACGVTQKNIEDNGFVLIKEFNEPDVFTLKVYKRDY